ncbi:MAG: DNA polymerase III subunit delta [Acidobacteriaceae bacterium]
MTALRSFASTDRFLAELATPALRPGYVLIGDELFLYERCRRGVMRQFVDPAMRDFILSDLDLAETTVFDALDRARTPSLMAPFQVVFLRNVKQLYTRGAKKEEFAAIADYFRSPNPGALVLFVADHLRIPTDLRRMDMQDKDRYERIRETLGEWCGLVELARVDEADAARWVIETAAALDVKFEQDAARELVDALGADMMMIASEFEKLMLYIGATGISPTGMGAAGANGTTGANSIGGSSSATANPAAAPHPGKGRITLGDVETMVLGAKQRSLYELTDAISAKDKPRALFLLQGLLNASDGGEDSAIGHLYMLARTFRQMLIISEKGVRDSRAIWQVLWQGFRMPPFAADDLIKQARRYKSRRELTRAIRLIARADLDVRSSPADKRLVLERLILDLASEPKPIFADALHQPNLEL